MPELNDIMRVRLVATCGGEPIINTLGFAVVIAQDTWELQANIMAAEVSTALGLADDTGVWYAGRSVQYKLEKVQVEDVLPGLSASYDLPIGVVGPVDDEDLLPPNDSLALKFRSSTKGPGGRGRTYLNGFAEGSQNGGYWVEEIQNAALAIGDALYTAFGEFGAGGGRWCIIHGTDKNGPLDPPQIRPVVTFTVSNQVRSIGRRAVGRRIPRPKP